MAAGTLLLLTIVLWPAPASAHATLVSTTPTDGSHLDEGPTEVTFTLNEAVTVVQGSPAVIDRDGHRYPVEHVEQSGDRTVVVVRLAQALPDGSFLATARLLSADTHVVSVSASFSVGAADGLIAAPQAPATGTADTVVSYLLKLLVYLGAVLSAGVLQTTGVLWPHLRDRPRWRAVVRWGSVLLLVGLVGRLVVEVARRSGGLGQVSGESVRSLVTVNGAFGVSALVAVAVTVVQLSLPGAGSVRRLRTVGAVSVVAVAFAVAYGGHGADPVHFPLPLLATLAHVYAVVAWAGGLAVIAVVLGRSVPIRPWHRHALAHVAVVAATGLGLGLLRIPALGALVSTRYGLTLVVKVVLVALALAAAALVYRRLARPAPAAPVGRGRLLGAELVLVLGVFGATGVLSSVAPATVSYDPAVHTSMDLGSGAVLDITIPSTRRGPQTLTVEVPSAGAGDADAPLSVDLSSTDANVARLPVTLGAGQDVGGRVRWQSRDLVVPVSGRWQVTVTFDTAAGPRVASFSYDVL